MTAILEKNDSNATTSASELRFLLFILREILSSCAFVLQVSFYLILQVTLIKFFLEKIGLARALTFLNIFEYF